MSVKVAVRVRPFNDREQGSKVCIRMVWELRTLNLFRMVPRLLWLSPVRVLKDLLPLTTPSGHTMDSKSTQMELWSKHRLNTLTRILSTMRWANKSSIMHGRATTAVSLRMVKQVLESHTLWSATALISESFQSLAMKFFLESPNLNQTTCALRLTFPCLRFIMKKSKTC